MTSEDYNRVFEGLRIEFHKIRHLKLQKPFQIADFEQNLNHFIYIHKGELYHGKKKEKASTGEMIFIPSKMSIPLSYGKSGVSLADDAFLQAKEDCIEQISTFDVDHPEGDIITVFSFETKIFLDVDFFHTLELPNFTIRDNAKVQNLLLEAIREQVGNLPGHMRMVKTAVERLVVEILRHVMEKKIFLEQIATNIVYFKDPRLVKIFYHIRRNIGGDLSNKVLAQIADVSEDYVGQYFKALTGINPQDYIEYQRMELAIHLLRTTKLSIADIGDKVGFNGTAYFCRRFKMMFGIPAAKMRRREKQTEN